MGWYNYLKSSSKSDKNLKKCLKKYYYIIVAIFFNRK